MSRTPYLDLNIPDKSSKGFVVTDVFEPNFTKLDQESERVNLRKMSTEDNIEELKKATRYEVGDVVEVLGYYSKGDGAGHPRQKKPVGYSGADAVIGTDGSIWGIVHSGEVNVSWFGAKGDGATDDTIAIQKALDFSDFIFFNKCTYLIKDTIILSSMKKLISNSTIIKLGLTEQKPGILYDVATEIRYGVLEGFIFLPTGNENSCVEVRISEQGKAFANNKFIKNTFNTSNNLEHVSIRINTNGFDGVFCNEFDSNNIFNGIEFYNLGDSNVISKNIMAENKGVKIKIIVGSNSNVFSENNVTCKGGVDIMGGGNLVVEKNNFEPFRFGTREGNYINFDGKIISSDPYPVLGLNFVHNSFIFSGTSSSKVSGIGLSNIFYANLSWNMLGANNNNTEYSNIEFVVNCKNVIINQFATSSVDNEIKLKGSCQNLMLKTNEKESFLSETEVINTSEFSKILQNSSQFFLKQKNSVGTKETILGVNNNFLEVYTDKLKLGDAGGTLRRIIIDNSGVLRSSDSTIVQLDTPYHASNMQKLGILDSYHSYLSELHEYEKSQNIQSNTDIMNLNVIQPPIIPTEVEEYAKEFNLI
ncbi:MAG: glycosyl hydrolase family 28-related protein [Cetobacterium sp.]|uniref:glycosyl hydrolase family 28-related protein n=1 Tax=Cetobacterium sp. TaxID=2071632 RepID=UPI003EE5BFB8